MCYMLHKRRLNRLGRRRTVSVGAWLCHRPSSPCSAVYARTCELSSTLFSNVSKLVRTDAFT